MAKEHDHLSPEIVTFIQAQPMFFVATAIDQGRVNLSPKGLGGSFAVLGPKRVAFLKLTGSGNETAAHLLINNRISLMFCSFDLKPMILRLYGTGRSVHPRDPDWAALLVHFTPHPGSRQIIDVAVDSIITSCGYAVPRMELIADRPTLTDWATKQGEAGVKAYWQEKNTLSLDGLPTGIEE